MKRHLLLSLVLLCAGIIQSEKSNAQVLFNETFNGIPGPTAGGAGTYAFPAGWFLRNVDNRTPNSQVAYVNDAWERREDFVNAVSDSCAFSTSWYAPTGAADDWMWTPGVALPTGKIIRVSWKGLAPDVDYRDGYEVRIMTVPPTGGAGTIGNQITNSTVIFSTTAENATWTNRSVDLNASYNGQTVYIGFRNNSFDKFLLMIDNVKIEAVTPFDASVSAANSTGQYSTYAKTQNPTFTLGGTVSNVGSDPLTNVNLAARVFLGNSTTPLQTFTGTVQASLAASATANFTCGTFTPTNPGTYTIKYYPVTTQTDANNVNDTIVRTLVLTDSTMSRDDGIAVGSLGIGAGNGGYIGQSFTIANAADLSSVVVGFTRGYTGKKYACVVWNTTGTGVPNTIIASTDTLLYPNNDALLDTIRIYGGKVSLTPGTYVVTAIEFDSTLALSNTTNIFTAGTGWVNWPTSPSGTWANVETFGGSFAKPFMIRLNLRTPGALPVKLVGFVGAKVNGGNKLEWKVAEQSGINAYVLERSSNGIQFAPIATINANNLQSYHYQYTDNNPLQNANFYRLKIVEDSKIAYSSVVKISGDKYTLSVTPQPVKNLATLQSNSMKLLNTKATLVHTNGAVMKQLVISQLPYQIDMSGFAAGLYLLKLEDNTVLKIVKQ